MNKIFYVLMISAILLGIGLTIQHKNNRATAQEEFHAKYMITHISPAGNGDIGSLKKIYVTDKVFTDDTWWCRFNRKDTGKSVFLIGGVIRVEEQ